MQNIHCIESDQKSIIINTKPAVISCNDCCYPIGDGICILFYNFCKTEALKKNIFFILFNNKITDSKAIKRIKNKKVDLLFIKNLTIYLKMIDHVNLIKELNDNIDYLKTSNPLSKSDHQAYDLFTTLSDSNEERYEAVDSKGKYIFLRKLNFNNMSNLMKIYTHIVAQSKNKRFINIYNKNKENECKNNSNSNTYPTTTSINYHGTSSITTLNLYSSITISSKLNTNYQITTSKKLVTPKITINSSNIYPTKNSINHQNTSSIVTLSLYPSITVSSKLNTNHQIITSQKIVIPTITANNYSSSNYIASTVNILLPTKPDKIYNSTTTKLKNRLNNSYSASGDSEYFHITNKNTKARVIYNYHYYDTKIFLSAVIIVPIVIIFITSLFIYKCYIKFKKKNNTNESDNNSNNDVEVYTIDEYHIYETAGNPIANSTNSVIAVAHNQNNLEDNYNDNTYELPNDYYQSISSINCNITEQSNQNENMNTQPYIVNEIITDDSSYIENNNNELDNSNSQNDIAEHNYNILESEDNIVNAS